MKIANIEFLLCNVSEKSNWSFIRVFTDDGLSGIGEATLQGWEAVQSAYLDQLKNELTGRTPEQALPLLRVQPHSLGGLAANSVLSALEMALTDIRGKAAGVPAYALFGTALRKSMRIYANINRRTRDRTPAGHAESACKAIADGYNAIKIAPFDDVYWEDFGDPAARRRIALGMERVFAVRDAIGPQVDLLIDCHWRFDEESAKQLIRDLAPARLYWMECLISENPEHHAALTRIRDCAREHGTRLAGAERQVGVSGFRPVTQGGLMDVVMPDIKYAGGYAEMLGIARHTAEHGIAFSPHNPHAPVCTLASLHVCTVAGNFLIMEHQLAESALYLDIMKGDHPRLVGGCYQVPETPGLGMELDDMVLRAHPYKPLPASALRDPRLG
jgi:galactonate dehydratase